jgi:hypothetical protein
MFIDRVSEMESKMNTDVKPKGAMLLVCRGEKYAVWMLRADQRAITANNSVSCTIDDAEWKKILSEAPFPEEHSEWESAEHARFAIDEWCEAALKFVAGHRLSLKAKQRVQQQSFVASS